MSRREEEEEILFCQTKHNKKTTQIAHNHGRLPEKGLRPSKLATYIHCRFAGSGRGRMLSYLSLGLLVGN